MLQNTWTVRSENQVQIEIYDLSKTSDGLIWYARIISRSLFIRSIGNAVPEGSCHCCDLKQKTNTIILMKYRKFGTEIMIFVSLFYNCLSSSATFKWQEIIRDVAIKRSNSL